MDQRADDGRSLIFDSQPLTDDMEILGAPRVTLRVAASAEGRQLVLVVEDSGLGLGGASTPGTGVGLLHVKERLAAVYGNAATAEMGETSGGGARVTLRLPWESETKPGDTSPRAPLGRAARK